MNRRSLLQALGLVAVTPVLSNIPAAAEPAPSVLTTIAEEFRDPLYAIAFTEGPKGERYRHHMPATMRHVEHKGRPWADDLVVEFTSTFTGVVRSVEIARGDNSLMTLYAAAMTTPNWVRDMLVRVTIGLDIYPAEDA